MSSLRSTGRRAFTLIELLVVIAIIGILSAIVIVSLTVARNKAADASIKDNLHSLPSQTELYVSNNNSYGSQATTTSAAGAACGAAGVFSDPSIVRAITAASAASGASVSVGGTGGMSTICGSGTNYWAVAVVLKTDPTTMWCLDSTGKSRALNPIPASLAAFTGC